MECSNCKNPVYADFEYCGSCGQPLTEKAELYFYEVYSKFSGNQNNFRIKSGMIKRFSLFLLVNAAIIVTLGLLTQGDFYQLAPFFFIYAITIPFITLLLSRWLAKRSHKIYIIDPNDFNSHEEMDLHELIESLSAKAGLKKIPQVGIYESPEMNAFATGFSKNRSLVVFSTKLLDEMEYDSIEAVAAHEIAHIANGDMVTLTLVQSVVNFLTSLILLPLSFFSWTVRAIERNKGETTAASWIITIIQFLVTIALVFISSLIVKAFSRRREFSADKLAAQLVNPGAMINALQLLKEDTPSNNHQQKSYAALKINSPSHWLDIFSTHPSLNRRIAALEKTFGNDEK